MDGTDVMDVVDVMDDDTRGTDVRDFLRLRAQYKLL